MLERLKSLPLTILLTILVWMYAEAQFATIQDNVHIALEIVSPSPQFVVTALDPMDQRYRNSVTVIVTAQGAKSQIDRLYQMSLNAITPDKDFQELFYSPREERLRSDPEPSEDTVNLINGLSYFRDRGITVTLANPPRIRLKVERVDKPAPPDQINPAPASSSLR